MAADKLPEFPDSYLSIKEAFIYGKPGRWAAILVLRPFNLDNKEVATKIVIDAFSMKVVDPRLLANQEFTFPTDEARRDLEGSIYLRSAHHPIDVSRVVFGPASQDVLRATIDMAFVFDHEGAGFQNRTATITCGLQCCQPKGISYVIIT